MHIFFLRIDDQPANWLIYADDIFDEHSNNKKVIFFTVRYTNFVKYWSMEHQHMLYTHIWMKGATKRNGRPMNGTNNE